MIYWLSVKERRRVQNHVLEEDFRVFLTCGIFVCFLQAVMLIYGLVSGDTDARTPWYRLLHCGLIALTVFTLLAMSFLKRSVKTVPVFYVIASFYIGFSILWSVGITYLNYQTGRDLSAFSYTMLTAVAIIQLEPWAITINTVLGTVILQAVLVFSEKTTLDGLTIMQSAAICILANVVSLVCFNRRNVRIRLEFEQQENIREIWNLNSKLLNDANKDALTGIYNRRFLTEHINQKLTLGEKASGVLMVDIDFFKDINDTYGHQNGDECLKHVGKIVGECPVDEKDYAVRYGGEEFLVYYNSVSKEDLANRAESLRKRIEDNHVQGKDGMIPLTASVGYAMAEEGLDYSELIGNADKNLYMAKYNGRNQIFPIMEKQVEA